MTHYQQATHVRRIAGLIRQGCMALGCGCALVVLLWFLFIVVLLAAAC